MSDIEKTITTLQYRINEARNNHSKVTTIFVSTLSDCMMFLKKLRDIERPGLLLFDVPVNVVIQQKERSVNTWKHLWDAPDGSFKCVCENCGFVHFFVEGHCSQYRFCPQCGEQKVKG